MRNLTVFSTWHGDAGEAAKQAMDHSATKLGISAKEAFLVSLGAQHSAQEARKVKADLDAILQDAAKAPAVQVDVASNTVTPPDTTGWKDADVEKLAAKIEDLENRIVAVLAAAEEADADLARVLTAATGGDPATSSEQGSADGKSLQDGQLTPEESKRLAENTTLTPEQQAALERGTLVLPASQMDYLNQLSRSLDGKSSAEIRALMGKLGPDGNRLADAFQLVSNEHVTASGVDPGLHPGDPNYVPSRGSFDALPDGLRRDLTSYPLQWQDSKSTLGAYPSARQELRDVAAIVEKGNPNLQQGSTLDGHLLKQAEIMVDETQVRQELLPFTQGQVDPTIQDVLTAAGRDHIAVHDALSGVDGKTPNDKFIGNLMTHQWADDGAAAGSLLHGTAPVANPTDLTDPTQLVQATRAGETMHAVDQWASANAPALLNIDGTDGQSLGQVNPELTRALSDANKPYIDDMIGNNLDNTRGFDPLDDPKENVEMPHTRDLFAVIDTDKVAAGTLNSQAYLNDLQYQHNFEQSIIDGKVVDTGDLQSAGTMRGVIDTAANIADNDAVAYGNLQDVNAYASRGEWVDIAEKVGGQIPGVKEILDGFGNIPGDPLHEMLIGEAPTANPDHHITVSSSDAAQRAIAQHLIDAGVGDIGPLVDQGVIDPDTGRIKSFGDVKLDDFRTAMTNYFTAIDPAIKAGISDYETAYKDALPHPEGHTGG